MPNGDNDFMEYGDSGLVALPGGWFLNRRTKETVDPNGCVFNENGDLMYDPSKDKDDNDDTTTD